MVEMMAHLKAASSVLKWVVGMAETMVELKVV